MSFQNETKNKTKKSIQDNYNVYGWLFISASVLLLLAFMFYPIVYSLYLSLTSTKAGVTSFVLFNNYIKLFKDPSFILALKNTFIFLIVQVPIMLTLAMILASILNDKTIKFRGLFRTAIFLPVVTSLISASILFKMFFAYDGLINNVLMSISIIDNPVNWLGEPRTAQLVLILTLIWRWTGYNMIFYLAGMQNISPEIYEAAKIDGANAGQTFFKITVPLLKPMILFTTIMSTIGTLQLFDEPMNLAASGTTAATVGPGNALLTLSVYIYNLSFKFVPNFGYAATVSWAIVFFVVILSLMQFRLSKEND